ncbi:uncharacterized protein [Panulirus ornatus]|uniref:uncharacterized protein n=1 Tax=Panulirus ornatus TaxID=150431 RepID=UPI003A894756
MSGPSEQHYWRLLTVPSDATQTPSLKSVSLSSEEVNFAFCQLYGPTGCWQEPPQPSANMIRDWDNQTEVYSRAAFSCEYGFALDGNMSTTSHSLQCLSVLGGWFSSGVIPTCQPMTECPEGPPAAPTNVSIQGPRPPYWVGTALRYTCGPGLGLRTGGTHHTLQCSTSGWPQLDPEFECLPVCTVPPPEALGQATSNDTGIHLWDVVIAYECVYGFPGGDTVLKITCDAGSWTRTEVPDCIGDYYTFSRSL